MGKSNKPSITEGRAGRTIQSHAQHLFFASCTGFVVLVIVGAHSGAEHGFDQCAIHFDGLSRAEFFNPRGDALGFRVAGVSSLIVDQRSCSLA